jgi:hypothetical protein
MVRLYRIYFDFFLQTNIPILHPIRINQIDTVNKNMFITIEQMNSFAYTNAYQSNRFVAIYAQQTNSLQFVNFDGIAAGVSRDAYMLTVFICCLLVLLFALIEYVSPSLNKCNYLNITTAIIPCFNSQIITCTPNTRICS